MSSRWKKAAVVLCLMSCIVLEACPEVSWIYAAGQERTDSSRADSAEEDGKQGMSDSGGMSGFSIDNQNIYEGMEKSYSRGYVPKIGNDNAVLVLPLQAKHKVSGNQITAALKFGEGENLPFVHKNYEKEVKLKYYKARKQGKKVGRYLVSFNLKLKKDRYNGSYPVIVTVSGQDESGNEISQEFTVYVTITDGKKAGETEGAQEGGEDTVAKFAPKVMIDSYQFSRKKILCGEKFTAKITLHNTSNSEPVKNMMVSVTPGENVELLGRTGSSYVQELAAGGSCDLSFRFRVNASAPRGQYSIGVTMDYADAKGGTHTAEGAMKVSAEQSVQIQIPPVSMAKTIQLGETVELQTQVMNLGKGKLYNVRATLEADGLTPSGAAFIGDVEAGTSMSGSMEVTAEGLTGTNLYGTTQGKITFYYADEAGNEMTQEQTFETDILSPLSGENEAEPEEDTRQWWVIMAVIVALLILAAVIFFVRRSKRIQTGGGDVNE